MSFNSAVSNASERFAEVQVLLNTIQSLEPRNVIDPSSLELKIMKGLFFVHLYAAFERTINEVVETTLSLISAHNIKNNHLSPSLLSVVFLNELKSIKDGSHSKILIKSSEMFTESSLAKVVPINETIFSGHLQNVWTKTIYEILTILGMKSFSFTSRVKTTIDEIVDKRNAVAHERYSASSVGERYRVIDLREKMEIISSATQQFISAVDDHYNQKKYIKPSLRRHYP